MNGQITIHQNTGHYTTINIFTRDKSSLDLDLVTYITRSRTLTKMPIAVQYTILKTFTQNIFKQKQLLNSTYFLTALYLKYIKEIML